MLLALLGALTSGCDAIYEDNCGYDSDYELSYRLRLHYDRNIRFAEAFAAEVSEVSVYAFDRSGQLVWQGSESGQALLADGYTMTLPLDPGRYDIIAWCHGPEGHKAFTIGRGSAQRIEEHCAYLPHTNSEVNHDLRPLFHGMLADVELPDTHGAVYRDIYLTKNTNHIRVMLQRMDGSAINKDDFDIAITDANGSLAHDNSPLPGEAITYTAWNKQNVDASAIDGTSGDIITSIDGLVAEMTVSRLVSGTRPMLSVRTEDRDVLRIPLIDYLLMVKAEYRRDMSNQDYLDRQDDYSLTFFLDNDDNWYWMAGIYINSWHVVLQFEDL